VSEWINICDLSIIRVSAEGLDNFFFFQLDVFISPRSPFNTIVFSIMEREIELMDVEGGFP
jgi:hypothetical protein